MSQAPHKPTFDDFYYYRRKAVIAKFINHYKPLLSKWYKTYMNPDELSFYQFAVFVYDASEHSHLARNGEWTVPLVA